MRTGLLGSMAALLTGAGMALADDPAPPPAAPPAAPAAEQAAPAVPPPADTHPWSPDLRDSNKLPYPQPPLCWRNWVCTSLDDFGIGEFWLGAEYLLWWTKDTRVPPLLTTGPAGSGGVIGQPGTQVLFGGDDVDLGDFSGGRFVGGIWLDECRTIGFEGTYFLLAEQSVSAAAFSASTPLLARPFFNVATGLEDARIVAAPDVQAGTILLDLTSSFQGAEATAVLAAHTEATRRVELLAGFRWLELAEQLHIAENEAVAAGVPVTAGNRIVAADEFAARNRFFGGQLGARAEYHWGCVALNLLGKLGLGSNVELVEITGGTQVTPFVGRPQSSTGGLLALPTNIGRRERSQFTVVPELGAEVGYRVTNNVRLFVGYSFIYWSDVVRPADQVDRGINPTQVPGGAVAPNLVGPARPAFAYRDTDFWAQGLNFGLLLRY